jgi:cyclase
MLHTRRDFCKLFALLALGSAVPRRACARLLAPLQQKARFANKSVPGNGIVIGSLQDGGNVLAMPSESGPIIIDAKFAHTAPDLLSDINALLSANPALLINTHHHADHSGGNWAFKPLAKIAAHKNFNARLSANLERYVKQAEARAAELARSDADQATIQAANDLVTKIKGMTSDNFAASRQLPDGVSVLDHGGVTMHVYHFGNGHTDNDLVVHIPKHNILHMGDLLFNNVHPFIDRSAKANTLQWQRSLRETLKLGDDQTVVIPGHGELTDKKALTRQIEYFDQLRDFVTKAIREGKSKEAIAGMTPDAFKSYGFEQLQSQALTAMYEEISEELH